MNNIINPNYCNKCSKEIIFPQSTHWNMQNNEIYCLKCTGLIMILRDMWKEALENDNMKFFVIDVDDLLNALNDKEIGQFNKILETITFYRVNNGKSSHIKYKTKGNK